MTVDDAAIFARETAPVIQEFVAQHVKALTSQIEMLTQRLQALEDRPLGERGADGARGDTGPDGLQGPEGAAGRDGRDGLPGVPGAQR